VVLRLAAYARALAHDIVPALRERASRSIRPPGGDGREPRRAGDAARPARFPRAFGGLFLQSGSFFMPRFDAHESGFARYARIVRFVRATLRDGAAIPVPVTLTVRRAEENIAQQPRDGAALAAQGYPVVAARGARPAQLHGWRDAFDPHLTDLLRAAGAMNVATTSSTRPRSAPAAP
jgi:enterochelin esterase-like enzyme